MLVGVLAAAASRVCPCAFPVFESSCPLTLLTHKTSPLLQSTPPLTPGSSRHAPSTIGIGASAALYEHIYDTSCDDWRAIALDSACSTGQSTSISASLLGGTLQPQNCSHHSWLGGQGNAHVGVLQLLEESECIHCPSFAGAVCSWHSPAKS
jgi:hypothetical protein